MNTKLVGRQRRARKSAETIKELGREKGTLRLQIHRSTTHIYAQIIHPVGGKVLAQASSLETRGQSMGDEGKCGHSKWVGKTVAERAKQAGIERVACDRSGFRYHGRVKALVEAAREAGLLI